MIYHPWIQRLFLLVALSLQLLDPTAASAHAVNVTFCVSSPGTFWDNHALEDEWQADGVHPVESAMLAVVTCSGAPLYLNYLDVDGCTAPVSMTEHSCVNLTLYPQGIARDNNTIQVFNSAGATVADVVQVNPRDSTGSQGVVFPETAVRRIYMTLAHVINHRFRGSMANGTIRAFGTANGATCGCSTGSTGSRSCTGSSTSQWNLCIKSDPLADETMSKYAIAHEYGHANLGIATLVAATDWGDYDCGSDSSHSLDSLENSSCVVTEGWADFVATDAWNDDNDGTNPNGFYGRGYGCFGQFNNGQVGDQCPGVDDPLIADMEDRGCDSDCQVGMMERTYGSANWPGRGTEIDFARTLWDYHTNPPASGGVVPGHGQMQEEFAWAFPWSASNAYERLRVAIALHSGCSQYARFVAMADANGADHCAGACLGCSSPNVCDNGTSGRSCCDAVPVAGCATCDGTGCQ